MAKFSMTVEGDDQDELKTALEEALTMLGGEASAEETEEEAAEEEEDLTGEDSGEEDETEAQKEEAKKIILKLTKAKGGPDKIRAALKKVKAAKLVDVDDEKVATLLKDLKAAAKALKIKV